MVNKFIKGKYYRFTGKTRPYSWNCSGKMDFVLDGKPHKWTWKDGIEGTFDSDHGGAWLWGCDLKFWEEVKEEETRFYIGDKVKAKDDCDNDMEGSEGIITEIDGNEMIIKITKNRTSLGYKKGTFTMKLDWRDSIELIKRDFKTKYEVNKMELKNIKEKNLKEAKKQFLEDKANAEVKFARLEIAHATDEIDRLDREIKVLEEGKKPHLEILKQFK